MATIRETVERNGHIINVYESGAEYDTTAKRLIRGPDSAIITSEIASEYNRRYREIKRAVVVQAANDAVEREDFKNTYGGLAFVAAITEAQYIKATTPEDPKSTAAARWVMEESGAAEPKDEAGAVPASVARALIDNDTARTMERIMADVATIRAQLHEDKTEIVDAE